MIQTIPVYNKQTCNCGDNELLLIFDTLLFIVPTKNYNISCSVNIKKSLDWLLICASLWTFLDVFKGSEGINIPRRCLCS